MTQSICEAERLAEPQSSTVPAVHFSHAERVTAVEEGTSGFKWWIDDVPGLEWKG